MVNTYTVSETFRNTKELLPNLRESKAFWNFFGILAFPCFVDKNTGKTLIPRQVIAKCEGKEAMLLEVQNSKNYSAQKFLIRFSKKVNPIRWSKWSFVDHECRVIEECTFPLSLQQAINNERNGIWKNEKQVYIHNGKEVTPKRQQSYLGQNYKEANDLMAKAGITQARDLGKYMNKRSIRTFQIIMKNMPQAKKVAENVKDSERQLNLLHAIETDYRPLYKPVARSARIYSFGQSMVSLERSIRKTLMKGYTEFDIRSSQLAIASRLWNIPKVVTYLKNPNNNIWTDLANDFEINRDESKDIFKTCLYSTMFGAMKSRLKHNLAPLNVDNGFEKFIANEIIAEVWEKRNERFKTIRHDGGVKNVFGQWISIGPQINLRSALAQEAQAFELFLLKDVIKLAIAEDGKQSFQIILWQHDGFTVKFRHNDRKTFWTECIKATAQKTFDEFDVPTTLECTDL